MKLIINEGEHRAMLNENYRFDYHGVTYVVSSGFRFDGASIPSWFWTPLKLHPFHPRVIRAALFHDYLYSLGYKAVADKGFKRMLKEDGCNRFQVFALAWAVKVFGKAKKKK